MVHVLFFFLLYETQILVRVLFHTRSGIWYVEYGGLYVEKGAVDALSYPITMRISVPMYNQ